MDRFFRGVICLLAGVSVAKVVFGSGTPKFLPLTISALLGSIALIITGIVYIALEVKSLNRSLFLWILLAWLLLSGWLTLSLIF